MGKKSIMRLEQESGMVASGKVVAIDLTDAAVRTAMKQDALMCRYYYYSKLHRLPYEQTMERLMAEFFLSEKRMSGLIVLGIDRLKELAAQGAKAVDLGRLYPHYLWTEPVKEKKVVEKGAFKI
jgi:hypothetical protein